MTRLVILSLAFTSCLYCQEPEKFAKLRNAYESAVARATAPLQKTYLQELVKLKDEYTRAAKLDEALVVAEAIKSLQPSSAPNEAKDESQNTSIAEIFAKKRPTNGDLKRIEACFESKTWEFAERRFCVFKKGGGGAWLDSDGKVYDTVSWNIEANGSFHINGFGRHKRIVLSSSTEASVEEIRPDGNIETTYKIKLSDKVIPVAK